jgi:CDP-glycerol glycerophosphotransferase (TagB/SpsB family)
MYGLAELMKYTAVNVNVASTITIDAAALDTPVVNVAFDGQVTKPYLESCARYYDYEHYKRIVDTGGVRIARNTDEMMQAIQAYLDDPSLESEGRRRIREEQCWKLDGNSGRRIAEYLIRLMGEEPSP